MKTAGKVMLFMMILLSLSACHKEKPVIDGQIVVSESRIQMIYSPLSEVTIPERDDWDDTAGFLRECCGSCMARIHAGNLIGSGVIYDCDEDFLWIATAAHVLDHVDDGATVTFCDGYEVKATKVIKAQQQDLAFLKLPRKSLAEGAELEVEGGDLTYLEDDANKIDHGVNYHKVKSSIDAYDAARVGDLVIAMGSRSGVAEDAYSGVLLQDYVYSEDFGAHVMLADVTVTPGMSGGALFDANGNLLGILCGVSEDGEVAVAPVIALMAMDR